MTLEESLKIAILEIILKANTVVHCDICVRLNSENRLWSLTLQQPVVIKPCYTPDPTSWVGSVAKCMHITHWGDKLKILQMASPCPVVSGTHTKTHRTEYLESLACDQSLIGWKFWHHTERRRVISLSLMHTQSKHESLSCQEAPSRPRGVINDFKQDGKRDGEMAEKEWCIL